MIDTTIYAQKLTDTFGRSQALALLPVLKANVAGLTRAEWDAVGVALQPVTTRRFVFLNSGIPWDDAHGQHGQVVELTPMDVLDRGTTAGSVTYGVASGTWVGLNFVVTGPTLPEEKLLCIASRVIDLDGEV